MRFMTAVLTSRKVDVIEIFCKDKWIDISVLYISFLGLEKPRGMRNKIKKCVDPETQTL